jgi:hypothetical protein
MKKTILLSASLVFGAFLIGYFNYLGNSNNRYESLNENPNLILDKKTGVVYFTDKKEYRDVKGDLYRYE